MNILFFSDHFFPEATAPAANIYERCCLWAADGHHVTVICAVPNFPEGVIFKGYTNDFRKVESLNGIRVVRVKTFIHRNEGFFFRIADYFSFVISAGFFGIFEPRPDVIISSSPHLFVPLPAILTALLRGIPHVLEVRDLWPDAILAAGAMRKGFGFKVLKALEKFYYHKSSIIISLTKSFVPKITSLDVPEQKIRVVLNGANLELFSPMEKDVELSKEIGVHGKRVIGYLGTQGLCHGLENVIEAAALIKDPNIVFLFVGTGAENEKLKKKVRDLLLKNVIFVPQQPRSEMPRYWSLCDASLIHLKEDPLFETVIPSKIFESMAMSIPILFVGPVGEGAALVNELEVGRVVSPSNVPKILAEFVESFLANERSLSKYRNNSTKRVNEFSRRHQADKTLGVLKEATLLTGLG